MTYGKLRQVDGKLTAKRTATVTAEVTAQSPIYKAICRCRCAVLPLPYLKAEYTR